MTTAQIRALPAAVDLVTAGRALGMGRSLAGDLARRGEFPIPVLNHGRKRMCLRADLLAALKIADTQ